MRALNFSLIVTLSWIAMTGATPIGDSTPAGTIDARQASQYVLVNCCYSKYIEVLTWPKTFHQSGVYQGLFQPLYHMFPYMFPVY